MNEDHLGPMHWLDDFPVTFFPHWGNGECYVSWIGAQLRSCSLCSLLSSLCYSSSFSSGVCCLARNATKSVTAGYERHMSDDQPE